MSLLADGITVFLISHGESVTSLAQTITQFRREAKHKINIVNSVVLNTQAMTSYSNNDRGKPHLQ